MARARMLPLLLILLPLAGGAAEAPGGRLALTEEGSHFFSGEQALRAVPIDAALLAGGGRARLSWSVSANGAVVLSGGVPVAAPGGAQILLPMPHVQRITPVSLRLSLERDGAALASGEVALQLYPPKPAPPAGVSGKRVLLLDPTGRTAAALDYLSIGYDEATQTWTAATGSADLIVVGDSVDAYDLARFLESAQDMVSDGAVCLILEQTGLDADRFPWLALAPSDAGWSAYGSPAGPDVVRGELPEGALAGWRDGGVLRPFVTPVHGDFTLLLDVARTDEARGQAAPSTAVLEVPHGKGRYVFSQLPLAQDFATEPAARYVLANLIAYAATVPPLSPPVRAAVLADPEEEAFTKAFDRIGLEADLNPPSLEGYGVVIVFGSEAAARFFRPQEAARTQALRDLLASGGKVVLLDVQPQTLGTFRGIYDGTLEVAAAPEGMDLSAVLDKPLVRGIRGGELEALCRREEHPLITYRGRRDPAAVSSPGLLAVAQGKGAIVFCQLPLPEKEDDDAAIRTFSQLFTNLHLTLEDPNRRDAR